MSTEVRSLASDFGGSWSQSQFHQEILGDVGITTSLVGINHQSGSDVINILFVSSLSGGEVTALNSLISAHSPVTSLDTSKYLTITDTLISTSTNYYTQGTLTTGSLDESIYKISWYYEYCFNEGEFEAQILIDDVTQIHHFLWAPYDKFSTSTHIYTQSGFKKIVLAAGVHTIKLQYRMPSGGDGSITNIALDIEEAGENKLY